MTNTIEKLIGLVETIVTTIVEIRASQINIEKQQKEAIEASNETNKINKEILEQLKEINAKMDEETTEESSEDGEEETPATSQEQVNAFFNAFMNSMQSQVNASEEVGSPDNEYPGYNTPPDDVEAIAAKIRNNAAAQQSINGDQFSSLDNFDFDKNFGGSSFNQSNDKPPEQPVYHRVEATPKQMNLDSIFNGTSQPTGNNWYNPQKIYHLGLTQDRQYLIFRRTCGNDSLALQPICQNSLAWNTITNMLKKENRKLSSLTNDELASLSDYMGDLTANGVDIYSPINPTILNQFNAVQNNDNNVMDVIDTTPTPGMSYTNQAVSSPVYVQPANNQYNPTPQPQQPVQDFSRRNMGTVQRSYVSNNMTYTAPVNSMWAHYGEEIANNSSNINQQPQNVSYTTTQQTSNFTNGGYTNPYTVKPVFGGSSFSIYG